MDGKRTRRRYSRKPRIIFIIILVIGIIGLSIGFSAYSKVLNIQNIQATVTGDPSKFKVVFSSSSTTVTGGTITASQYGSTTFASFSQATINNSNPNSPQITGLKGTFTVSKSAGQYVFYVFNEGSYKAYLKKITFGSKKCTPKQGTSSDLVSEACKNMSLEVQIGSDSTWYKNTANITNHPLEKGTSEIIRVWMAYDYYTDTPHVTDGDFDVEFGDITLTYSSSDS